MAIPAKNVLGNPNVTEGNFQVAIEQLRESVIGSGKAYDSANTYMQYDTCVYGGVTYYSKINSNTGNTPSIGAIWGLIGDLFYPLIINGTALGYGTGSGGTVTQLTSKSTAVTLNKPCGQITMNNAALAAGASVLFPFYNSTNNVDYDQLIVNMHTVVSGYDSYRVEIAGSLGNGGVYIRLTNISGVSLAESPSIKFTVIKGATA